MRIVFIAFLVLLFLAPLPYGLVSLVPQTMALLAIWLLAASAAVVRLRTAADSGLRLVRWEAAAFAVLVAWICFQMLPIGGSLAHPLWSELPGWLGRGAGGSISLSPALTLEALLRLLAYAALFWLVLQFGRDRDRAQAILVVIVVSGLLNALYGIVNYAMGNEYVLLAQRYAYTDDVTGTFVNRNSAAAFFGLTLLPAAGYLAMTLFAGSSKTRGRSRTEKISALQAVLERGALAAAVVALPGAALLMNHSRAGLASVMLAVLAVALLALLVGRHRGARIWLPMLALGVGLAIVLLVGADGVLDRLMDKGLDLQDRAAVYSAAWNAFQDSPWLGFGYGTFERSFLLYAPGSLKVLFTRAHNDWLEGLFGLGWIGALLLNGILVSLVVRSLIGASTRRRDQIFGIVAVAAGLQLAVHSLVDFSLQIPAVTIYFVTLLALGVAQSVSSKSDGPGHPAPD